MLRELKQSGSGIDIQDLKQMVDRMQPGSLEKRRRRVS